MGAGCFPKKERHGFIQAYCYPDTRRAGVGERAGGHPPITAAESSFEISNCSFFGADGTTFECE